MWSSVGNAAYAWDAVRRYMKKSAAFGGLEIENMNGVMSGIIEVKPPPICRYWVSLVRFRRAAVEYGRVRAVRKYPQF